MPPLRTKKTDGPQAIRKDVSFVAKDDGDQVATGIVMVPDKVDLQNDFVREDQLQAFADQFENFEDVGEAGGGVMHAVWPEDHIDLERNEVLEESQTIGGETAPEGAWIQSWEFTDDELWGLVEDGILEGYSVGIDGVRWDGPYDQDDEAVDDVEVPEEIEEDEAIWQIVDGIMREVSAVDIPAVPDAQILDKAAAEKRLAEHLGNRDAFLEEAQDRGHSEGEAERLWEYLNDAVDIEGAGEPGKTSFFHRIGKAAFEAVTGSDDDSRSEAPDRGAAKEGRTLSADNKESAMAAVDANLDILEDAGVNHSLTRFTDQEDVDFDLSEHDARTWSGDHDDGEDSDDEDEEEEDGDDVENHAPEGETSDDDTTDMSDTPDEEGGPDAIELAEKNAEQINDLADAVDELTRAITGEEKTREIELAGETVEVTESELKAALGVEESGSNDDGDITVEERVKNLETRIDSIAEQGGASNQIRAAGGGDGEDDDKLSQLGEALS